MYLYLLDYTEKELKFPSTDATFLLSVIGIANTVGEVIIGWVGDQSWTNLNGLYCICMLACGVATASVPFLTAYQALAVVAGMPFIITLYLIATVISKILSNLCGH